MTARFDGDTVALQQVKETQRNPNIDPIQVARLLWRQEALAILEQRGLSRGYKSCTADVIAARLVEVLSIDELSAEVRAVLKSRGDWLGKPVCNEGQMPVGGIGGPLRPASGTQGASRDLLDSTIGPTAH